ncbi:unnamed protein product [Amoebophrya sp. A120]|nr:unnamed protein product [Amoebophrya sp. A120]|eukprot:GSA120T00005584001.1
MLRVCGFFLATAAEIGAARTHGNGVSHGDVVHKDKTKKFGAPGVVRSPASTGSSKRWSGVGNHSTTTPSSGLRRRRYSGSETGERRVGVDKAHTWEPESSRHALTSDDVFAPGSAGAASSSPHHNWQYQRGGSAAAASAPGSPVMQLLLTPGAGASAITIRPLPASSYGFPPLPRVQSQPEQTLTQLRELSKEADEVAELRNLQLKIAETLSQGGDKNSQHSSPAFTAVGSPGSSKQNFWSPNIAAAETAGAASTTEDQLLAMGSFSLGPAFGSTPASTTPRAAPNGGAKRIASSNSLASSAASAHQHQQQTTGSSFRNRRNDSFASIASSAWAQNLRQYSGDQQLSARGGGGPAPKVVEMQYAVPKFCRVTGRPLTLQEQQQALLQQQVKRGAQSSLAQRGRVASISSIASTTTDAPAGATTSEQNMNYGGSSSFSTLLQEDMPSASSRSENATSASNVGFYLSVSDEQPASASAYNAAAPTFETTGPGGANHEVVAPPSPPWPAWGNPDVLRSYWTQQDQDVSSVSATTGSDGRGPSGTAPGDYVNFPTLQSARAAGKSKSKTRMPAAQQQQAGGDRLANLRYYQDGVYITAPDNDKSQQVVQQPLEDDADDDEEGQMVYLDRPGKNDTDAADLVPYRSFAVVQGLRRAHAEDQEAEGGNDEFFDVVDTRGEDATAHNATSNEVVAPHKADSLQWPWSVRIGQSGGSAEDQHADAYDAPAGGQHQSAETENYVDRDQLQKNLAGRSFDSVVSDASTWRRMVTPSQTDPSEFAPTPNGDAGPQHRSSSLNTATTSLGTNPPPGPEAAPLAVDGRNNRSWLAVPTFMMRPAMAIPLLVQQGPVVAPVVHAAPQHQHAVISPTEAQDSGTALHTDVASSGFLQQRGLSP